MVHILLFFAHQAGSPLLISLYWVPVLPDLIHVLCTLPQEVPHFVGEVLVFRGSPDCLSSQSMIECVFGACLYDSYILLGLCSDWDRLLVPGGLVEVFLFQGGDVGSC